MPKNTLIFLLAAAALVGSGTFIWRVQNILATNDVLESETLRELSADEIHLILKSQADSGGGDIADNPEDRKAFLKGIREYLALAAEARREGLTQEPGFKINLEYKKDLLLAGLYRSKLERDQGSPYVVPAAELDAIWTDQANVNQFETDMATMRQIQAAVAHARSEGYTPSKLQGESLDKARAKWAQTKILAAMAKGDAAFMAQPVIELRIKLLEAGILSADYLRRHWADKVAATPSEIAAYLNEHPEYDVRRKHEKAQTVLRRALSGDDFIQLAAEFSEDRSTKSSGGLYENVEKNMLWPEVEAAALGLQNGRIAPQLVETDTGFHIVKLENKTMANAKNGGGPITKYSFRHILLQKNFEEPRSNPDVPPPFMTAAEIAKGQVEQMKRSRLIDGIVKRNQITLPAE